MSEGEQHGAPGGPQDFLARLVGAWEGVTRTWFEPGELADESPWQGVMQPALDGLSITYRYEGSIQGQPLRGFALLAYNAGAGSFEQAWIDSFHTGNAIMFSQGRPDKDGFSVLGSYSDPGGGPDWGWRTRVELPSPNRLQITAYNISPEGDEARAVETIYSRRALDLDGDQTDATPPGQGRLF